MTSTKHHATTLSALAERPRRVTVDGRKFLVCLEGETVYAYRNVCPHQYGPVVEGKLDLDAEKIICPWHGWEFDLDGGTNPFGGDLAPHLSQADTLVEGDDVYLLL